MKSAVIATLVTTAAFGVLSGAAGAKSAGGVSARIELKDTAVRSGSELKGFVVIRNETGREVTASGCHALFQVVLSNHSVKGGVLWLDCLQQFTIPTGRSRFPVTVRASYGGCTEDADARGEFVRCDPDGSIPGLPPGKYRAKLYQRDRVVADPPPVPVRVLAAKAQATRVR
jgi:hypothetical protein